MTESGNPALSASKFLQTGEILETAPMSVRGTMTKTGLLFLILIAGASWTWSSAGWGGAPSLDWRAIVGFIGGLILALVTIFNPLIARYTAPAYAFAEGMLLGGLSSIFEYMYPGIVMQAVLLTIGVFAAMWFLYTSGLIKVTARLRMAIFAATGGIALVYILSIILSMFGTGIPLLHSAGPLGIGISLVIVGVAAFNLLLDYDFIDRMTEQKAPGTLEWYGAFALMMTLVWLYIEILRLLSKMRR